MSAALQLHRRLHDFLQRAVDAVAHADLVLEALEVDVRRAALHGVGEDGVDQLDDRRVVHLRLRAPPRDILFALPRRPRRRRRSELVDVVEQRRPSAARPPLRRCFSISVAQRELARDDREDVVARDELEVLEHAEVRRVGHRDGERAALALERQDEVLHAPAPRGSASRFRDRLRIARGRPPASWYCRASIFVSSISWMKPSLTRL